MSLTYGFYNSVNHDRPYNTTQISKLFDGLILDGIFMAIGTRMVVKATTGMGFKVGVGRAWFNHTWTDNDADLPMTLEASDVLLDRFDAVVLEVDSSDPVRANTIKIIKGTPASTPVKPSLTNTEFVHQYPLCYITVGKNVTEITDAVIENKVGTSDCPFATGVIQGMNIDDLIAQWNSEFDAWFQRMKDQLSTDAAGNLQSQIDAHLADTDNPHGTTPEQIMAFPCKSTNLTDFNTGDALIPGSHPFTNTTANGFANQGFGHVYVSTSNGKVFTDSGVITQRGMDSNGVCVHRSKTNTGAWTTWEPEAGGNGKTWVATAVSISTDNLAFELTIPNFVFSEGCRVSFVASITPPAANPWVGIKINGANVYFLRKNDHNNFDGDEWTANTQIEVTLSSISIPNGTGCSYGTAFFKGGAGIKELYDFPLSMQTAAPTPVNASHIWVVNDTKRLVLVDDFVQGWADNCYFFIVDNTNNNYIHLQTAKKTTDGTPITFTQRNEARDTASLCISSFGKIISKKYGLSVQLDSWIKYPRVYSKVNGVVDVETAYHWDGSAWQLLSQKGSYLAVGFWDVSVTSNKIYNRSGNALTLHSDLPGANTQFNCVKFSADGIYLACGSSLGLQIYKRTGDSFVLLSTTLHTSGKTQECKFSPDGNYLAVCDYNNSWYYSSIYKKQADGTWAYLCSPQASGSGCATCAWSPDGNYVAFDGGSNNVMVYKRNVDTFSLVTTITNADARYGMSYDSTGNYIAISGYGTNSMKLLHKNSESSFTVISSGFGVGGVLYGDPIFLSSGYIVFPNENGISFFTYSSSTVAHSTTHTQYYVSGMAVNRDQTLMAIAINTGDSAYPDYVFLYTLSGTSLSLVNGVVTNLGRSLNGQINLDFLD